jgi:hypothetical protein
MMGHDQSKSPATTRTARNGASEMPALPAHAVDAGFGRRGSERRGDHWTGARSAGTNVETAICAHGWENALPLVRTILRDGRRRHSITDLFRRRLPLFSREKLKRHRPRSSAG